MESHTSGINASLFTIFLNEANNQIREKGIL